MLQKIEQAAPAVNPASDPDNRRTMIGATDAGIVILGEAHGKTRLQLAREKRGEIEPEDISDLAPVRIGSVLEDSVATLYTMETGRSLCRPSGTCRHPEHSFVACHPDFYADNDGLVECKTAGIATPMTLDRREQWGDDGSDEIPVLYLIQCHYQMLVTGARWVDLAALIGGQGLRIFRVNRDEAFCQYLLGEVVEFWTRYVVRGEDPEPMNASDCKLLYPKDDGTTVQGTDEHVETIRNLLALKASRKEIEDHIDALETRIKAHMGEAHKLEVGGQVIATWGVSYSDRIDTARLRSLHPAIARECSNEVATRRFLAKKIKEVA